MVHPEKITYENFEDIFCLKVKQDQKGFAVSNLFSVAEAYVTIASGGYAFPFAVYSDKKPVGFIMIDRKHRNRGYGKEALRLALDFIKTWPCGKAEYCRISYEAENEIAKSCTDPSASPRPARRTATKPWPC